MPDKELKQVIDECVASWLAWKEGQATRKNMGRAGFEVSGSSMSEMVKLTNGLSKRLMKAVEYDGELERLESLGELLLTAAQNVKRQREDKTFMW